jgi:hypothetical protein
MFAARNLFLTASAVAKDLFFRYVTMLLPGNGTNGRQNNTFLDSSTNNFTITRNGNTTQGTFSPYGSLWSNYFDGTGDWLKVNSGNVAQFGTGDFTMEAWVFLLSHDPDQSTLLSGGVNQDIYTQPNLNINTNGTVNLNGNQSTSNTVSLNVWTHVAVSRNSGTSRIFINGVQGSSASNSLNYNGVGAFVGLRAGSSSEFGSIHGYVSNARVIIGTGLYSSNFTPPTSPLTAVSGTSLLTCQSNRFIDNSTNAFTITRNGDVSVQRFSPFNPTAPYAASTDGGSGYFDGTGDYLSAPSNSALALPGDFTFECWVNPSNVSGDKAIYSTATSGGLYVYLTGSSVVVRVYAVTTLITAGTIVAGQWSHIAVTRSGTTVTLYVNGTSVGTATSSQSFAQATTYIGSEDGATFYYAGYISNLRLVKGSVVYTSAFTPPTTPLTAITNTSLLLNYTNAGILDNAEMNNLETVGNAQISTAQSKFGGGSMLFDGSGDTLATLNTPNLRVGSGNFTIEFWVYFNAVSGNPYLMMCGNAGATTGFYWYLNGSNNRWELYIGSTAQTLQAASPPATGQWYHVALVRNGSALTMYVNGSSVASATNSSWTDETANPFYIGSYLGSNYYLNAYIDDLRITKGYARYTANFTPPSAPFPTQ